MSTKQATRISEWEHDRSKRTFLKYFVGLDGHLYHMDTGERKYFWYNQGRGSRYARTQFYYEGKKYNIYLHRIVALINLVDFDDDLEVNHINGNTLDNSYHNLNMRDRFENAMDALERANRVSKTISGSKCEVKYGHINQWRPDITDIAV